MKKVFRDAVIVTLVSGLIGLAANLVHPKAIPFLAREDYQILVPCPEPGGEVSPLEPGNSDLQRDDSFVIDARDSDIFATWHFKGAISVPFDYLDPTPEETIKRVADEIARMKARRVVVYGDGDTPDTGEQLGKEISGHGIKNVFFLKGGAPALRGGQSSGGGQ
jgi:hypothetical protein